MIVDMKKTTVIVFAADRDVALERLRDVGVLHPVPIGDSGSRDLDGVVGALKRTDRALGVLAPYEAHPGADRDDLPSPTALVDEVLALAERQKETREALTALNREAAVLEPYGDFDPADVARLAEAGVRVRLYQGPADTEPAASGNAALFVLHRDENGTFFAVLGDGEVTTDGTEFPLPERSRGEVLREIERLQGESAEIERRLAERAGARCVLQGERTALQRQERFIRARDGMGAAGALCYINGFCPADRVDVLQAAAREHGWALRVDDPARDEEVPTLIRLPRWAECIRPLFGFLGITPGYRETDVSVAFLFFLTIFFAMIVGDAGYGILFLMFLPYARRKFPSAPREPFRLLTVFSVATVVWGVLTGNYFGLDGKYLPRLLTVLRIDALNEQGPSMTFSLLLGAIHLTLAHGWKAIQFGRSPRGLTQVGWIGVVWGIFFLARQLIIEGASFPVWFAPVAILGAVAVVTGIALIRAWLDLGLLALDLVSCFGDIMSYLRLFALGIASVQVAAAFNRMAGDLGVAVTGGLGGGMAWLGFPLAALGMAAILVVGHLLNIILCAMSVLVHGVRLNALEFSLHMGQEWSGKPYQPFAHPEPVQTT